MTEKQTNTGGPAFPTPAHNLINDSMTLRDYFAAKAMQGCWANSGPDTSEGGAAVTAKWAYIQADAMLKARES